MAPPRSLIIVALLLIALGTGWLLSGIGLMPEVNWVWVGLLAVAGLLTLALGGIDRFTLTFGPFLIAAAIGSALRQSDAIPAKIEVPALVIAFGVLLLANLLLPVPNPKWIQPPHAARP